MTNKHVGSLHSAPFIKRYAGNPILTAADIPYPSELAYNAGVVKYQGQYVMAFRNDYHYNPDEKKADKFQIGLAYSDDGIAWRVEPKPILEGDGKVVLGSLDPRITLLEGRYYLTYFQFTYYGYRATIVVTDDFQTFTEVDRTVPDNRDNVLFPEKIGGRYFRLERPFPTARRGGFYDIWISESPDLTYWGKSELLLPVEAVPYANERLGAGPPPLRTEHGWLVIFHAVDKDESRGKNGWEDQWQKRYTAGVMLLDLENPRKVLAVSIEPLMVPQASYEVAGGFRNNIVFPTALVAENNGEGKLYYGAADTVMCLATTNIEEMVMFCLASGTPLPFR